jgi:hypothetical protein
MRRRKRKDSGARFVLLQHWMLKCPAWRTLPSDAKALLLHLWERHNGANNGEISFGVREAEEIGITKTQAARMLLVLVNRGFLKNERDGGFNVGDRKTRTWRLTAEPYRGQKGTNDFMQWSPDPTELSRKRLARPQNSKRSPYPGTTSPYPGTKVIKLPATVPGQGLIAPESPGDKSLARDTYIIPCVPAKARGWVTAQESDPAARAKRTDLDDYEDIGGPVLLADVVAEVFAKATR